MTDRLTWAKSTTSMNGKARYPDSNFILRFWRRLDTERVNPHVLGAARQAKAGFGRWANFWTQLRPQAARGSQPPVGAHFNATQTDQQAQAAASINQKSVEKVGE